MAGGQKLKHKGKILWYSVGKSIDTRKTTGKGNGKDYIQYRKMVQLFIKE